MQIGELLCKHVCKLVYICKPNKHKYIPLIYSRALLPSENFLTQFAIVYSSFIFQFLLSLIELLLIVLYFLLLCLLLFLLLFEPVLDGNSRRHYI